LSSRRDLRLPLQLSLPLFSFPLLPVLLFVIPQGSAVAFAVVVAVVLVPAVACPFCLSSRRDLRLLLQLSLPLFLFPLLPVLLFVIPQGSAVAFAVVVARSPLHRPKSTLSRPKAAHFTAATERPLYFAFLASAS
jgi:hypothetical protein